MTDAEFFKRLSKLRQNDLTLATDTQTNTPTVVPGEEVVVAAPLDFYGHCCSLLAMFSSFFKTIGKLKATRWP